MPNQTSQPDDFATALQAEMQRLRAEASARYEEEKFTNPESAGKPLIGCNPELARWILAYGARAERERVVPGAAGLTEVILKALEDEATDHGRGFFVDRIERHKWDLMAGYIATAVQPLLVREQERYEALAAQLDKDMYWEPDETADWLRVKYQDGHIPEPIVSALREQSKLPEEGSGG
jgi:hypothetical protein